MAQEIPNKKIDLRVRLNDKLSNEFRAIKEDIGMENNTDIIRWLIHEKYEEIRLSIKSK